MVHQSVQYNSKGINIYSAVIFLTLIHLRCHIRIGTFLGKSTHGSLKLTCNSEISQLKISESGYKNILRFNIPVNNLKFSTVFQCFAQIHPQLYYFFLGKLLFRTVIHETCKIFHPYGDFPANGIQILHYLKVLYRDNVGVSSEIFHGTDFLNTFLHQILEILSCGMIISCLRAHTVQFTLTSGDINNFDSRIERFSTFCSLCLIYLAKRAFADFLYNLPFRPCGNRKFFIHIAPPFLFNFFIIFHSVPGNAFHKLLPETRIYIFIIIMYWYYNTKNSLFVFFSFFDNGMFWNL